MCKISLVQNVCMVSENAFPAFKTVALTRKVAATCEADTVHLRKHRKSSKCWISSKSIQNPGNPENYENGFDIAATFPASATGLETGNAFFGTMKRFCTDEILQFSLWMNEFWEFWPRKSWQSRIWWYFDQFLPKSMIFKIFEIFKMKKIKNLLI